MLQLGWVRLQCLRQQQLLPCLMLLVRVLLLQRC
jgi:hypothetical protein